MPLGICMVQPDGAVVIGNGSTQYLIGVDSSGRAVLFQGGTVVAVLGASSGEAFTGGVQMYSGSAAPTGDATSNVVVSAYTTAKPLIEYYVNASGAPWILFGTGFTNVGNIGVGTSHAQADAYGGDNSIFDAEGFFRAGNFIIGGNGTQQLNGGTIQVQNQIQLATGATGTLDVLVTAESTADGILYYDNRSSAHSIKIGYNNNNPLAIAPSGALSAALGIQFYSGSALGASTLITAFNGGGALLSYDGTNWIWGNTAGGNIWSYRNDSGSFNFNLQHGTFVLSNFAGSGSGIVTYNGVNTAGIGVPAIYAATKQKSETQAADATVVTLTPATVSATMRLTYSAAVSTESSSTIGFTVSYKDANGTSVTTQGLPLMILNSGNLATSYTGRSSAPERFSGTFDIDIDNSGTAVTIGWLGGGTTTAAKVSATIEQLQ